MGVLLLSGDHSLLQEHLYRCEDEGMSTDCVRKCVSRHWLVEIKRYFHFNDNNEIPPDNSVTKCYKVLPL